MRKTKIVCTIGPASSDEAGFARMCLAELNVARLNFSHGTHSEHLMLEKGNSIVMTAGTVNGKAGNTNIIKVENV